MIELILAYTLLLAFFLLDSFLRTGKTAKSLNKTSSDRKSTLVLVITFFVVLFISILLNYYRIGSFQNPIIAWSGVSIMAGGLFIRILSIRTLGKFYTRKLLTTTEQDIIQTGIYKQIRHPGYLGTILIWSFAGLAMQNMIVFFTATFLILLSYSYRINSEEQMLTNIFGEKYTQYKKHSWHLIPYIW